MKIKATVSFASANLSMYAGEIRECVDGSALSDLLKAGYIEEIAPVQVNNDEKTEVETEKAKKKKVAKNEGKSTK